MVNIDKRERRRRERSLNYNNIISYSLAEMMFLSLFVLILL